MSVLSERDRLTIQAALARSAQAITHVVETMPQLRAKMSAWERGTYRSSSIPEAIAHSSVPRQWDIDPFDKRMRQDIRVLIDEVLEIEKASGRVWRLVGLIHLARGRGNGRRGIDAVSESAVRKPCAYACGADVFAVPENEITYGQRLVAETEHRMIPFFTNVLYLGEPVEGCGYTGWAVALHRGRWYHVQFVEGWR